MNKRMNETRLNVNQVPNLARPFVLVSALKALKLDMSFLLSFPTLS